MGTKVPNIVRVRKAIKVPAGNRAAESGDKIAAYPVECSESFKDSAWYLRVISLPIKGLLTLPMTMSLTGFSRFCCCCAVLIILSD